MSVVTASLIGRMGNQAMTFLFAKAYAEAHGHDFQCSPPPELRGAFMLDDIAPLTAHGLSQRNEFELNGEGDVDIRCYAQSQKAMIYTKAWAQRTLRIRPEWLVLLEAQRPKFLIVGHRRVGDYAGYGYPIVSQASYERACERHGLEVNRLVMLTEETAMHCEGIPQSLSFLADFYAMMDANILLRGNSSFSWLAGLLGNGRVFSPIVEDKSGEQDCEFVEGNWPRFCHLTNITDLHLP